MPIRELNSDRFLVANNRFIKKAIFNNSNLIQSALEPGTTIAQYFISTNTSNSAVTSNVNTSSYPNSGLSKLDYNKMYVINYSGAATGDRKLKSKAYGLVVTDFAFDILSLGGKKEIDPACISFYGYPILIRWSNTSKWQYNFGGSGSWSDAVSGKGIQGKLI